MGTTLGVMVSTLGIRMLELFVEPAAFGALPPAQRSVFMAIDVLFTGAVLGRLQNRAQFAQPSISKALA